MAVFADHHVRRFHDGVGLLPDLEAKLIDRFVRDRRRHDRAVDVDPHVRRRRAFLDFDDLALEAVARADLHALFLRPGSPMSLADAVAVFLDHGVRVLAAQEREKRLCRVVVGAGLEQHRVLRDRRDRGSTARASANRPCRR